MKRTSLKSAAAFYVAGVSLIHLVLVWNARELVWKGYPDFTIYYTAGTMLRHGMGRELYDDEVQFRVQEEFAPQVATRLRALPFNHPPFEAVLFFPLTYFSYHAAFLLWTLANLAMLAALPYLIRPYVSVMSAWPAPGWTVAGFAFFPIFFALLQGQDAILLLFLYALVFISIKKERFVSAGAWLALGLFKFHLVLPFLLLLLIQEKRFQSRKRILCGFLAISALLGLVSISAVGVGQMMAYPGYVMGLEETMARTVVVPSDMANLRGMLYLIASNYRWFEPLVGLFSVALFLCAAWRLSTRDDGASDVRTMDLNFSLAVFATVLVSYHALGYDLCVLALPMLLLADQLESKIGFSPWTKTMIRGGLALLLFSPLQLVLLTRYKRLALIGWALLLCFVAMMSAPRSRLERT